MPNGNEIVDLNFLVDNCVTSDPDNNKDQFYFELDPSTNKVRNLPEMSSNTMRININK